ncbi:MAG: hypothetical protein AB1601_15980 [Planctomycetota bacterium]
MNRKRIALSVAIGLGIVCLSSGWATAQTCAWLPGEGLPGLNGSVNAMTTWDPDGAGTQAELLVVGGEFSIAGEVFASGVAGWNGTRWQPLGSGITGDCPYVNALAVYNGELIAGGGFTTARGVTCNSIARWNGSQWQPLGVGLDHEVEALTVFGGGVIAGGSFITAGGHVSAYFARWACTVCPGDLNCVGVVSFGDINPFDLALSNWPQWKNTYPNCPEQNADVNGDGVYGGVYGFGDINPFVELLAGSGGYPIPCP